MEQSTTWLLVQTVTVGEILSGNPEKQELQVPCTRDSTIPLGAVITQSTFKEDEMLSYAVNFLYCVLKIVS